MLGVWSIILALTLAIVVLLATQWSRLVALKRSLDDGANASVLPIFNTASLVGFGAVIAALPAFELVRTGVLGMSARRDRTGDNALAHGVAGDAGSQGFYDVWPATGSLARRLDDGKNTGGKPGNHYVDLRTHSNSILEAFYLQ